MHANWHFPADETAAEMQHKNIINTFVLRRVKNGEKIELRPPWIPVQLPNVHICKSQTTWRQTSKKQWKNICLCQECSWNRLIICEIMHNKKWNMMVYWGIMRLHSRQLMHLNVRNVQLSNWHFPASGAAAELLQKMEETNRNYSTLLPPHVSHISP